MLVPQVWPRFEESGKIQQFDKMCLTNAESGLILQRKKTDCYSQLILDQVSSLFALFAMLLFLNVCTFVNKVDFNFGADTKPEQSVESAVTHCFPS